MVDNPVPTRRRLGDILLAAGLLTAEQLQVALEAQKKGQGRLGEVLISLGFVTEFDVANTLAEQLGLPFVTGEITFDPEVARMVPEIMARKDRALPVARGGRTLVVATSDPLDLGALDDIAYFTGLQVKPMVVTERSLQRAVSRAFQSEEAAAAVEEPEPTVEGAEEGPAVRQVHDLIGRAVDERASDIHLEPGEGEMRYRLRVDGRLYQAGTIPRGAQPAVVSRIKVMGGLDISERRLPQDGRFRQTVRDHVVDFRVSVLPTIHGEKIVLRILDQSALIVRVEDLGLEGEGLRLYAEMLERPFGIILVSGPTGSGKTTTLMASLLRLNRPDRNLVTIEDPVEYQLPGVNQVQVNVRSGLTFAEGLRSFLRQDPDVIMVGEIRDGETADIGIRAALTGHLVLSTIHTNSAVGTITRLVEMGVEPFLIGSALSGIVAQRLVRRLCPRCRAESAVGPEDLLGSLRLNERIQRPVGCSSCHGTGYRGRLGLFEILRLTPRLRTLLRAKATVEELQAAAVAEGMETLLQCGVRRIQAGETSVDEVRRAVYAEEV